VANCAGSTTQMHRKTKISAARQPSGTDPPGNGQWGGAMDGKPGVVALRIRGAERAAPHGVRVGMGAALCTSSVTCQLQCY
jgi:hypothetical protein